MPDAERSAIQSGELALLQRVAQREQAAAAEFYRTHVDTVFRFVYRRVEDCYEDAEEITQDAFQSAFSLIPTYKGTSSVSTWLCGIAKLRIVDFYRRRGREKRIPSAKLLSFDESFDSLHEAESLTFPINDMMDRIDAARLVDCMLESLADDEREALMLRYVEELSVREVADVMQRTEKAIENLVARAKKKAARAGTSSIQRVTHDASRIGE